METRESLLAAGATLFAERGIEGVSLREITRHAGQRNVTALQYYFHDRDGLLRAILEAQAKEVAAEVGARLDALEAAPAPPTSRELVQSVALPLSGRLDVAGGPEFLCVAAQVVSGVGRVPDEGQDPFFLLSDGYDGIFRRWAMLVEPHMAPAAVGGRLHQRFAALRHAYGELARRARTEGEGARRDLFESHLVDVMEAIVLAKPSAETLSHLGLDASF